jgi:predicted MFS family arabinose efflux permease
LTRSELGAALAAAAIMATRMLGLFMVYPLLVPYARTLAGSDAFLAGASLGVYGLTQGCLQLPLGALSDRWGRRRVLALGLGLLCAGSLVAAFVRGIVPLLVGRALQGTGAVGSVALASVGDRVRPEHRVKAMAVIGVAIGGSFVLAILLGPVVAGWGGVRSVFGFTALLALLALVVFVPGMPAGRPPGDAPPLLRTLRGLLARADVRRTDYGIFVQHAALTLFFVAFPTVLARRVGLAPVDSWRFYLPVLIVALLLVGPIVPRLEKGARAEGALAPSFLVAAAALLALAFLPGRIALWVSAAVYFVAFTLLETLLPAVLSRRLPPEARGSGMGLYSSAQFLGIFMGGLVGGLLLSSGVRPVFFLAALLLVSSGFLARRLPNSPSATSSTASG